MHLYHVTPAYNVQSILKTGIDPNRSRGTMIVSWYTLEGRIEWAINHVAKRHDVDKQAVVVFEVDKPLGVFANAATIGVFTCTFTNRPIAMYPAYNWFPYEL